MEHNAHNSLISRMGTECALSSALLTFWRARSSSATSASRALQRRRSPRCRDGARDARRRCAAARRTRAARAAAPRSAPTSPTRAIGAPPLAPPRSAPPLTRSAARLPPTRPTSHRLRSFDAVKSIKYIK